MHPILADARKLLFYELAWLAAGVGFAALLRNVARLNGVNTGDRMQLTHEGARLAGLDGGIVGDLLTLERGTAVPTADPARLFPAYLAAVEQLAQAIDSWRAIQPR